MDDATRHLRILEPYPGIYAYYDGRVAGTRLHSRAPNWLDDGAFDLGTATYAIVDGRAALVYDTHITPEHARAMRDHLASLGVETIRVVLSHWHHDHVAGNAVFADCEIVALKLTVERLAEHRDAIENADPPTRPLVMPTRTFDTALTLEVGRRRVECHHFAIHSADGCVLWLPEAHLLFAGDTLEDTVTYVAEPENIPTHIDELARLRGWPIERILPNHGDPDRIAAGGYGPDLIDANRAYLTRLRAAVQAGESVAPLADFVEDETRAGSILYFEPYAAVHRRNTEVVRKACS